MKVLIPELLAKADSQSINACASNILSKHDISPIDTDEIFVKIIAELRAENNTLTQSHNISKRNQFTQLLMETDELRDNDWTPIGMLLRTFVLSPDKQISEAAKAILEVYEAQGDSLTKKSYNVQTSGVQAYLSKMKEAKYVQFVSRIPGLAAFHTNLETHNNEFVELYNQSKELDQIANDKVWPGQQRKVVLNYLNKIMIPYLNVLNYMNEAKFGNLAGTVAEHIQTVNANVRATTTRKKKNSEKVD